ncbi:alpha/beta fold hydrolase [Nonomuraea rubra]|uniref:alpha/beta fold hydrolase n=1 Tax=Nonomuraea rubra TaxID=46180 RepID=UPI003609F969
MIIRVVLALALSAPPVMTPAGAPQSPCPVPVPARTSCGFLEVPERRDAPERKIKVGYAVHLSTAADREPDPVVYMSGGPGSASMQLMGFLSQMFPDRDVVTVEQRGSRYSQPSLACPETAQALLGRLRQPPADVGAAANRCRERLAEQGVDLRGYNTKEIAADVVALRQKLGYASWNLFGVSYSTRVMTEVAAADPEGAVGGARLVPAGGRRLVRRRRPEPGRHDGAAGGAGAVRGHAGAAQPDAGPGAGAGSAGGPGVHGADDR